MGEEAWSATARLEQNPEVADWFKKNAERLQKANIMVPEAPEAAAAPPAAPSVEPPPAPEPVETLKPAAKEPWQMTKAEIVERDKALWGEQSTEQGQHAMLTAHRKHVIDALREGKPVPPEVLADYPDLAKPPAAPVETKGKRKYSGENYSAGAKEFRQLVVNHGLEMGWFTNEDLMAFKPTGGHGDIHWDTQLRKAYRAALKDIGLNPDRLTEQAKFNALPKLKEHLAKNAKLQPVPLDQLPDGSEFTILGEVHRQGHQSRHRNRHD